MLERGHIILFVGIALLISGIIVFVFWTGFFVSMFTHENTILSVISVRPDGSVSASINVTDTSRPVSLAINVGPNNSTTSSTNRSGGARQIPNNTIKETVLNPNGVIMTSNEFT